jgi:putative DNA primase/helicase
VPDETAPSPPDLLKAALDYANRGIPVLPVYPIRDGKCSCPAPDCRSPGKHPIPTLVPTGLKEATTDEATIRRWWGVWPDANIGGALGRNVGLVLDVDPRNGGEESLAAIKAEHGTFARGPIADTGGGGIHKWFGHPGGTVPPSHGFRPGLDLQGDGSYVLLPPSNHISGRRYRWIVDLRAPLPFVPPWLLALADSKAPRPGAPTVVATPEGRIPHGHHHDYIVRIAASWASKLPGITEDRLLAAVRGALREVLDDFESHEKEIEYAVRSAWVKFGTPIDGSSDSTRGPTPSQSGSAPAPPAPPPSDPSPPTGQTADGDHGGAGPLAGEYPEALFTQKGVPDLYEIACWLRSTDRYLVPVGHDTFSTPNKFDLFRYENGYYNGRAREYIRTRVGDAARVRGVELKDAFRDEVVKAIANSGEFHAREEELNPPDLLCLQNGILDPITGEVTPHTPDRYFTYRLAATYDPQAKCPRFDQFMEEIQPDPEKRTLLIDLLGYCLWRRNPFQKFFVFTGDGANGKTRFLDVIHDLMGEEAVATESLQRLSADRFAAAELRGKLVNLCDDLPYEKRLDATGRLKSFTGEGIINVERKFAHPFKLRFEGKLISAANRTPPVSDDTYAFWRRAVVIPFPVTIPPEKRDPKLRDALRAEVPGILNRALEGLLRVRSRTEFDPRGVFEGSREEWQMRADPVLRFVKSTRELGPDKFVVVKELYRDYVEWCREEGFTPLSETAFGTHLNRMGFVSPRKQQFVNGKRVRVRYGIGGRKDVPGFGGVSLDDDLDEGPGEGGDGGGGVTTPSNPGTSTSRQKTPASYPGVPGFFFPPVDGEVSTNNEQNKDSKRDPKTRVHPGTTPQNQASEIGPKTATESRVVADATGGHVDGKACQTVPRTHSDCRRCVHPYDTDVLKHDCNLCWTCRGQERRERLTDADAERKEEPRTDRKNDSQE